MGGKGSGQEMASSWKDNRWFVLAVLFLSRVTMAFQFQSVAALSPVYQTQFGTKLGDIGLLIGLYLAPGLVIALPGGAIGRRFGDRSVIAWGMGLMIAGALIMILSPDWTGQIIGRVLAGTGGVLLNVLMTKLVTDHFAGREIATAMGIFVNSWPVGIAAALLFLPLISPVDDTLAAQICVALAACAGLILFVLGTRPSQTDPETGMEKAFLSGKALAAIILAGGIWSIYNGALSMVFSFGPAMLVERDWPLAQASGATSIVLWLVAISVPLGGVLADWTKRKDGVMLAGFVLFAIGLLIAPGTGIELFAFVFIGLFSGLSAGPVMSLPAEVLSPGNRALGMGVFFTLFYTGVVLSPILGGALSDWSGSAAAAFYFGAALLVLCCAGLFVFRRLARDMQA